MRFLQTPLNKKMKVAVFGLFHKEFFFSLYWQNYYGKLFGFENLYVIADLKNETCLPLFNIPEENFIDMEIEYQCDFGAHVNIAIKTQKKLLEKYDVVIFAETDEFFIPNLEKYENLKDFLEKNNDDFITPQGYNVWFDPDSESPLDPTKSLLSQRKFWYKNPGESKTLIVRKPVISYSGGFHITDPKIPEHPDLFNIHMHELDFCVQQTRNGLRFDTKRPFHPAFREDGHAGWECFIKGKERELWHRDKKNIKQIELIPEMFINSGLV
jgi:hypothetical protein